MGNAEGASPRQQSVWARIRDRFGRFRPSERKKPLRSRIWATLGTLRERRFMVLSLWTTVPACVLFFLVSYTPTVVQRLDVYEDVATHVSIAMGILATSEADALPEDLIPILDTLLAGDEEALKPETRQDLEFIRASLNDGVVADTVVSRALLSVHQDAREYAIGLRSLRLLRWAPVVLAILIFLACVVSVDRYLRGMIDPLELLYDHLHNNDTESMQFASNDRVAPDVRTIVESTSAIRSGLDSAVMVRPRDGETEGYILANALLDLLDRPAWVVDAHDDILASNLLALERIAEPDGDLLRGQMREIVHQHRSEVDVESAPLVLAEIFDRWDVEALITHELFLLILRPVSGNTDGSST